MSKPAQETPMSLQIMDSEYRIVCPPDEREALLTAAQHLNDTMQGIRNTGKVVGIERIAVMAALNISYELLNMQQQSSERDNDINHRIAKLLQQTDGALERLRTETKTEL